MSNSVLGAAIGTAAFLFMNELACRRRQMAADPTTVVDLNGDAVGYFIAGKLVTNKQMAEAIRRVKNNDE